LPAVDAAAAASGRRPPRSLDWQPALREELPKAAAGADAGARLRALTAMRRHHEHVAPGVLQKAIRANCDSPDRYLRMAAADLVALLDKPLGHEPTGRDATALENTTFGLGAVALDPQAFTMTTAILATPEAVTEARLAAVRVVQKGLGGLTAPRLAGTVWEGYSSRRNLQATNFPVEVLPALRRAFPSGHADLDRELSRTLAVLEDDNPATLAKVAARFTATSDPVEDIHYLIVLARLRAPRPASVTTATAKALLALDRKLAERHANRDRHWPLRIAELQAELARKDPGLNAALLADPEFGRADHALLARAPGFDRRRAAEVFLAGARKQADYPWNAALIDLLGALPEAEALPVLRDLWGKAGLDADILPSLARHPQPADRDKFI
jgi:hypothetical protein